MLFLGLWTLPFAIPAATYFQIRRRPAEVRALGRVWVWGVLWAVRLCFGVAHRVRRPEGARGPEGPPRLVAANHQSWWETIAFIVIEPDACFVAKSALGRLPVFGWYARAAGTILIDRAQGAASLRQILREGRAAVAEGRTVVIFPEGARRDPIATGPIQGGVAMLARALELPITPVVHDAGRFLGKRLEIGRPGAITPGTITVRYLPEIPLERDVGRLTARVERALAAPAAD